MAMTTASTNPRRSARYFRPIACARTISSCLPYSTANAPSARSASERLLRASAQLGGQRGSRFPAESPRAAASRPVDLRSSSRNGGVMAIALVEQREDGAGVGDDHRERPMPFSRSSARSLRSARPLAEGADALRRRAAARGGPRTPRPPRARARPAGAWSSRRSASACDSRPRSRYTVVFCIWLPYMVTQARTRDYGLGRELLLAVSATAA